MIYEDEYLNGERKNIKEYDFNYNGNLIFEVVYLNEKRNGKGKEYNEENFLIFEGE